MGIPKNQAKEQQKPCKGCIQPIHENATICPHCRTQQKISPLNTVLNFLKWTGGITALATLILAATQIHFYYEQWQEKQKLIQELLAAARIQQESMDYTQALELLNEASSLAPFSSQVRMARVDLAMKFLRSKNAWQKNTPEIVTALLPILVRNTAVSSPQKSADIKAHIGWAYVLLTESTPKQFSIDPYFVSALEKDGSNGFAHLFRGYWLLSWQNQSPDPDSRFQEAVDHFTKAVKTGHDPDFFYSVQLRALETSNFPQARLEIFKMAMALHHQNLAVNNNLKIRILKNFDCFNRDYGPGASISTLENSTLDPAQLLDAFKWLYRYEKKIHLPGNMHFERYNFTTAFLTQKSGNREKALSLYRALKDALRPSSIYHIPVDKKITALDSNQRGS